MLRFASLCSALALPAGLVLPLRAGPVRVVIASANNPAPAVREFETRFGAGLIEVAANLPETGGSQTGRARATCSPTHPAPGSGPRV